MSSRACRARPSRSSIPTPRPFDPVDALTYAERFKPEVVIDIATSRAPAWSRFAPTPRCSWERRGAVPVPARAVARAAIGSAMPRGRTTRGVEAPSRTWPTSAGARPAPSPQRASCRGSPRSSRAHPTRRPAALDDKKGRPSAVPLLVQFLLDRAGRARSGRWDGVDFYVLAEGAVLNRERLICRLAARPTPTASAFYSIPTRARSLRLAASVTLRTSFSPHERAEDGPNPDRRSWSALHRAAAAATVLITTAIPYRPSSSATSGARGRGPGPRALSARASTTGSTKRGLSPHKHDITGGDITGVR